MQKLLLRRNISNRRFLGHISMSVEKKRYLRILSLGLNFPAAVRTSDQLQNFDRALAVGGHDHWGILSPSHRRNELSIHAKTTKKYG